jgi:hypothetical protein
VEFPVGKRPVLASGATVGNNGPNTNKRKVAAVTHPHVRLLRLLPLVFLLGALPGRAAEEATDVVVDLPTLRPWANPYADHPYFGRFVKRCRAVVEGDGENRSLQSATFSAEGTVPSQPGVKRLELRERRATLGPDSCSDNKAPPGRP